MKTKTNLIALGAVATLCLIGGAVSGVPLGWQQEEEGLLPDLPEVARGVRDVLFAQPYALDEAYTHAWRSEAPETAAGYLLVLEVDEAFTVPRDTLESVLYVGDQTAERINWGTGSGRVVALVPAPRDANGAPDLELADVLMFYGSPELPERVDAARIAVELESAEAEGLTPLATERVEAALAVGGELLSLPDRAALARYAAMLVLEHSPAERDLAQGILAPLIR